MDILDIYKLMDKGFGVRPEILVYQESPNFIGVRLSKEFKGERYYHQSEILNRVINPDYVTQFNDMVTRGVELLQRSINEVQNDR